MICLSAKISKHVNDILQKHTCALLRDVVPEFYGFKTGKVKELINPELPDVSVVGGGTDMVFLTDEDAYLHLGFETGKDQGDIIKHLNYDARLVQRDGRNVDTIIIYTADVKEAPQGIQSQTLTYNPHVILMAEYDGDAIYVELNTKIKAGEELSDKDILNLLFLPLMRTTIPRNELAAKSAEIASTIPDPVKRNSCVAAAYAFAHKYLSEEELEKILEVVKMSDMGTLLVKDRNMEIAKSMLKDRVSVEFVARHTGLDEETVQQLKDELDNE